MRLVRSLLGTGSGARGAGAMDQYCILGRIGEGAHGIVFKAKHVQVRLAGPGLRRKVSRGHPAAGRSACSLPEASFTPARARRSSLPVPCERLCASRPAHCAGHFAPTARAPQGPGLCTLEGGCGLAGPGPHLVRGCQCLRAAPQTGEIVALKKVALRRLEEGIPNQALREIKALQEIEDNQYVSGPVGRPATPSLHLSPKDLLPRRFPLPT